jgi:nitrogenase molybdenum-iron protein NifN
VSAAARVPVPIHPDSAPLARDATVDPCTLCAPLGACLVAAGVRGAVPLLHGAQGCATYIRRYLISHFREPIDIASSSFSEAATVFGGEDNLGRALDNLTRAYRPELVAVATTCLAETIGEDVPLLLRRYAERHPGSVPVVHASTPSFRDGHVEGFHTMVHAIVRDFARDTGASERRVNVLPPPVSPADLRHLRELVTAFELEATLLPDYSDTLDGVIHERYRPLPEGGTPIDAVARMPRARATLDLTLTGRAPRASALLAERGVPAHELALPIGVEATDAWIDRLAAVSERPVPAWIEAERGRLLDAYADGHKVVFGRRVAVYGDPELTAALVGFLLEIGARPVVAATGARNRALSQALSALPPGSVTEILDDADFTAIEAAARRQQVELFVGSSKGYRAARGLGVPLLRVGFPIHDRIGAGRCLHVGYRGTTALFDALVNQLLETQQDASPVGFSYL